MYIRFKKDEKHIEFKDGDERNEVSDNLDVFDDAGYILTDTDLIVDIDDLPQATVRTMLEMFNIKTQTVWSNSDEKNGHTGVHLYFKKPEGFRAKQGVVALGFPVEYKHLPSTKYVTMKRHGVARKVENAGIREELPPYLMTKFGNKPYNNLLSMDESEGRNNALFHHIAKIRTIADWRKIARFINEHIFNERLPEDEMAHLLRDQDIVPTKDNHYEMATSIMRELNTVKYNNAIYFKYGNGYSRDEAYLEKFIWDRCAGQKSQFVNEIIAQVKGRSRIIDKDTEFPIKFLNGILRRGKFVEIDYTDFTPYSLDYTYDPNAKPVETVDSYLRHLTDNDPEYIEFVKMILGHTLVKERSKKNTIGHIFFFIGRGGNGKGTLLRIIEQILQTKNTSQLDIPQLTDERYLFSIADKLANLGDDIEDKPIDTKGAKILKNISTCDTIEMRKLHENSQSATPMATLIFTTNHMIKTFEKSDAIKRRFIWCPMYTKVKKKDPNFIPSITTPEALNYWVRLMVEGYKKLYEVEDLRDVMPVAVQQETAKFNMENNLFELFLSDLDRDVDVLGVKPRVLVDQYRTWCDEEGLNPVSMKIFNNAVIETFDVFNGVEKIDGRSVRVWRPNSHRPPTKEDSEGGTDE